MEDERFEARLRAVRGAHQPGRDPEQLLQGAGEADQLGLVAGGRDDEDRAPRARRAQELERRIREVVLRRVEAQPQDVLGILGR